MEREEEMRWVRKRLGGEGRHGDGKGKGGMEELSKRKENGGSGGQEDHLGCCM